MVNNGKMTRRGFLVGGACLTGACIQAGGAGGGADGGKKTIDPALAVLVSDVHVPLAWSEQKYRTGREYPYLVAKIRHFVDEILSLKTLPSHLFCFGDVSLAFSEEREYEIAAELFRPIEEAGVKIVMTVGNHDMREPFLKHLGRWCPKSPVPGKVASVTSLPDFDLVLLDSLKEPKPADRGKYPALTGCELGAAQKEWFEKAAAEAVRPTIVGAHHMAGALGITKTVVCAPKVFGYIHGHNHQWEREYLFSGYSKTTVVRSQGLPSFGIDRDIGYALLRSFPDRAELTYVARDYYFPCEVPAAERPPLWNDIVRDNHARTVRFPFSK